MLKRMIWVILIILFLWSVMMAFLWQKRRTNPYVARPGTVVFTFDDGPTVPSGTVVLTFDDGPTLPYTPQVLSILKKNKIHATFFVLGKNAKKHPKLVKKAYREGHAIACHGVVHKNFTKVSEKEYMEEVRGCQKIVRKIIGKDPICFRPPYNQITKESMEYIQSRGMVVIPVGLDSSDWESPGVTEIVNRTLSLVRAKDVITFHDGTSAHEDRSQTVAALPILIKKLRKMGLEFSRICYP